MAHLSGARLVFDYAALPWLPGARRYAQAWIFPGGAARNAEYYTRWVTVDRGLAEWETQLLFDPQTSGGLLIAVPAENVAALLAGLAAAGETAWEIGYAEPGGGELLIR
jgi:selenide,water dikinase